MKEHKALILTADGVEDLELFYPYYRLKEAGVQVEVAAPSVEPVTGKHGYTMHPDLDFSAVLDGPYDLLVLPGGKGPEKVRLDQKAVGVARKMMEDKKTVAAICHGVQTLISARVLNGRKATCWKGIRDDLKAAGAEYLDQEVVVDDNLITSRNPDDLPAFCREILRKLKRPT
jgi:protease I